MREYSFPFASDVITEDDPTTLDEDFEAYRISLLPENLQRYAVESKQNQLDAMPSYTERYHSDNQQ